jgi:hypothetical protein
LAIDQTEESRPDIALNEECIAKDPLMKFYVVAQEFQFTLIQPSKKLEIT